MSHEYQKEFYESMDQVIDAMENFIDLARDKYKPPELPYRQTQVVLAKIWKFQIMYNTLLTLDKLKEQNETSSSNT